MRVREARLKPAYGDWYPKITLGVWHNAAWLTEMVLQQQRRGSPRWALENRPLSEAHFDFQGHPLLQRTLGSAADRRREPLLS